MTRRRNPPAWHAALVVIVAALSLAVFAPAASADTPPPIPASANWETTVEFYRAMAGLPGITEDTTSPCSWSCGGERHSRYMAENNVIGHSEDPSNFYYTPEGDAAAQNGNVAMYFEFPAPVNCTDRRLVEMWMVGPFHAVGIVDPKLAVSGFGKWVNQTAPDANTRCAGTLDVLRGLSGPAATGPVYFPSHGTTTPLLSYGGGEYPNPLSHCGYGVPSGPPILLQLQSPPGTSTVTLRDNGAVVPSCSYDENTYTFPGDPGGQSLGRAVLAQRHAIVVIPQGPLTSTHTYRVTVQLGATQHNWSFFACAAGQNGGTCNVPTAVTLRTASAVRTRAGVLVRWRTASESQTVGFNVYRVRHGELAKLNRTLIPSVFGGTASGHGYSWLDRSAPTADSVRYRIQAVSLNGKRSWIGASSVAH